MMPQEYLYSYGDFFAFCSAIPISINTETLAEYSLVIFLIYFCLFFTFLFFPMLYLFFIFSKLLTLDHFHSTERKW